MLEKWKVLVVVDESDAGKKAVDCAVDLSLSGFNIKPYLMYVHDTEPIPIPSEKEEKKFYDSLRAKAKKTLFVAIEKLKETGLDFEVVGHYFGIAGEEIERKERELKIDMIIIGTEKPSLFKRLFGENYAERAIFETKAPVLVVKPEYEPKIKKLIDTRALTPVEIVRRKIEREGVSI
ncbi:hypothetical protein DRP05_10885 [Archaeoglobales archaeon]|nr:MAG: hypothetical protein DRP05_10885 [Archaeoglobales archaeon]